MVEQPIHPEDLAVEMEFAVGLAHEAADIVSSFYAGSSEVRYKSGDEPVTDADRRANQHLVSRIRARFPKDGILSEESKDDLSRLTKDRVWIVDPLDGTKEFIAKNGEFSVMIGLAVGGQAGLGVVIQPTEGLLFAGARGIGAFLVDKGRRVPLIASDSEQTANMTMVTSRSHRQKMQDEIRVALGIERERVCGSVGLKVGLIARRLADLYVHPSPGIKEWDLCAPQALLEAAGGRMTDCWGVPLQYNKADSRARTGLIASNGHAHEEIVEKVARICEAFGFNRDQGFW